MSGMHHIPLTTLYLCLRFASAFTFTFVDKLLIVSWSLAGGDWDRAGHLYGREGNEEKKWSVESHIACVSDQQND
jgi:hypothetical protein